MDNVADIYELSPMQQGMLFHTIASPEAGMYVEQVHCHLEGALDITAFRQTWARMIARHDILRSAFFWEDLEKPLQVVHSEVEVPFDEIDWRARPASTHERDLAAWRDADRGRGFAVDQAPPLRFTLIRLDTQRFHFVWTFHHLLLDGWSVAILFEEAFATYAALHRGQPLHLDAPPAYRDYITWIQAQDRDAAETFWRQNLAGFDAPTILDVATRPAAPGSGGHAQQHLALDRASSAALGDWARHERVTLNTAIQGAWAVLASRYGRKEDVVFGATLAERPAVLPDIDRLVGLCINTLPVRATIDPQALPGPWLRALQERQIEAGQYSATSLVDIQRWSAVPAGTPLFDSLIVFENYPLRDVAAAYQGMLRVADLQLAEHTNYPLTLVVVPGEALRLTASYDTGRFDAAAIERLLGHLRTILEAFTRADIPLGRLPIVPASEWALLQAWANHGAVTAAQAKAPLRCLHEAFAEQAARTPKAVAVRHSGEQLTYAELDARGNQLAHCLHKAGVAPGTLVGLCVERSLATVTAILGILKAGGAYVPLDPDSPAGRLSFILQDAAIEHLVVHDQLRDRFPALPAHAISIDHGGRIPEAHPDTAPAVAVSPGHTAYVIYTSGSTGQPKGVYITHANVSRLFGATAAWFQFGAGDVWTLFHSYAFDFSVWELWGALLYGGRVIVVPYWVSRNPEAFRSLLAEEQVTVLNQTPSAFYQLMRADEQAENRDLALRCVVFGGEALDLARLKPWIERHGDEQPRLINMYGITETTVHVTYRPIRRVDAEQNRGSLIGQPIPDLALAVLDPQGQPVPIGVAGELYVGGPGVGQGYLDRSELTQSRFVVGQSDVLTSALPAGTRWYRSGDLVRYLADGELEYLGRIDQQIKLRGFRIELGEIETVLAEHPAVQDSAVLLREDQPGHKRLVGYVVPARHAGGTGQIDDGAVLAFLHERLPEYMVPGALVVLPAFPLTVNGKLDRGALPAPEVRQNEAGPAPRGATEVAIADIWSQVLGVEVASREDNFFALGGDSILAMQVVSRARAAGLALTPRLLFQQQTIAAVAAALADSLTIDVVATEIEALDGEVPLTPIQRWFAELDTPNPHHFNQSLLLEVDCGLEPELLQAALNQLVDRHPALRLRWRRDDHGGWVQYHAPAAAVPLDVRVIAHPDDHAWHQALASVTALLQGGLHLQDGPVLRAALVDDGKRARIFLVAHHAVIDGVSWRILLEDLALLLTGGSPLPASTPFAVWARALERHAVDPAITAQIDLWAAQLRELPTWPGPGAAGAGPDDQRDREADSRTLQTRLDAVQTRVLLQDVHPAYRTVITDVLLTALTLGYQTVTRSSRLVVDLESHGRFPDDRTPYNATIDLGRTVGWFTSLYPARLDLPDGSDLGVAIQTIKEQLRALPQGGLGYGLLRYLHPDAAVRRRLTPAAPVPVVFNYLGQIDTAVAHGPFRGLASESSGADADPATLRTHALNIAAYVRDGQLVIDWQYGATSCPEARIEQLAQAFHDALLALLDHCCQPASGGLTPSDLPLAGLERAGIDALLTAVTSSSAGLPAHRAIADVYPLTPLQTGMLYHSLLRPEDSAYVEQVSWQIDSALDVDAFRAAWALVAERHAVFRTAFASAGLPRPLQVVFRHAAAPWQLLDWRHLDAGERARGLEDLLARDRGQGFVLDQAPLVRWTLVRAAEARYHCVWTHHHLLLDGWSIANVLGELLRAYAARCRHENPVLPRVVPYRDYIAWVLDQDLEAAQAFWRECLAGIDQPTPLPAARSAVIAHGAHAEVSLSLDREQTATLEAWARDQRLTLNTLVQGAWALLLGRYSGQDSVLFGATVAGRPATLPGAENLVGLCINTLPVPVHIAPGAAPAAWLQALQDQQSMVEPHAVTSLTAIQGWSRVPRGQPLFESIVVFENYPVSAAVRTGADDLAITGVQIHEQTDLPLTLIVLPGDTLELKLGYSQARYDVPAVTQLLHHLARLLAGLTGAPTLAAIDLLSDAERWQVLQQWNATEAAFPRDATLVDLLADQAARTPDTIAVSDDVARLTHRQLHLRAQTLARYLRSQGVGPETRVGVHMHRCVDMVVALLGILQAGGAYVPLDPDHPEDRLAFLIDDARPILILSQEAFGVTAASCPIIAIDAVWAAIAAAPPATSPALDPAHPAYLIYTSGSTG